MFWASLTLTVMDAIENEVNSGERFPQSTLRGQTEGVSRPARALAELWVAFGARGVLARSTLVAGVGCCIRSVFAGLPGKGINFPIPLEFAILGQVPGDSASGGMG